MSEIQNILAGACPQPPCGIYLSPDQPNIASYGPAKYTLQASQTLLAETSEYKLVLYAKPLNLCFSFTSCNWVLQILEDIK